MKFIKVKILRTNKNIEDILINFDKVDSVSSVPDVSKEKILLALDNIPEEVKSKIFVTGQFPLLCIETVDELEKKLCVG